MDALTLRVNLDCLRKDSQAIINAKVGEANGRKVVFTLYEGRTAFFVPAGVSVIFRAQKPDGTILYNHCVVDDGKVEYTITSQTVAVAGVYACELQIVSDGRIIYSPYVTLNVMDNLYSDTEVESSNEFTELENALNRIPSLEVIYSKYTKPEGGIPKTDLAQDVQNSLSKADTALQEHQSLAAYRTAEAQDLIDNAKQDKLIAGKNITIADDGKTISSAGKANALGYFRATYTRQSAEDFTLGKTFAQVKEEIANNNLIMLVDNFSDIDGMFILTYNSSGTVAFTAMIDDATGWLTFAVTSDDKWQVDVQSRVTFDIYDALSKKVGNPLNLTTADKTSLVAAVNGVKGIADNKQDKLIAGENITIAADGKTISATGGGSSVPKPLTYDYMPEGYPSKVNGIPLLKEQVVAFTLIGDIYVANIPNPSEIVEGQTYTVNWDGTEYECVCGIFNSNPVIGNLSIAGGGDDTGEPFLYMYTASQPVGQFGTLDTSASHTIAIKKQGEGIIPMAYYYMPEGYPKKTTGTATVMEEQEFSFEPDEGGRYKAVIPSAFEIVLGNTYIVKWDGTEYECVSFPIDQNEYAFGNLSIFGVGEDTGVPFIYVPTYGGIFTLDTSATHTVGVKTTAETAIPMSAEFIPKMNVSAFTNDAGYLTLATLPKYGGEIV